MLPSGPRYTYPLPSRPQPGARDLARQILSSIDAKVAKANDVRPATVTTGCDGLPLINALDGTSCNGDGGPLVLYNPQTRTVMTNNIGRAFTGAGGQPGISTVSTQPASCDRILAGLKAKRRFVDNLGNVYGPTGSFLTNAGIPAQLEREYIHRLTAEQWATELDDPPHPRGSTRAWIEKTTDIRAALARSATFYSLPTPPIPTVNDVPLIAVVRTSPSDANVMPPTTPVLEDVTFGGIYTGTGPRMFRVIMKTLGTPDTFKWVEYYGGLNDGFTTGIPITGSAQALAYGITVKFGSTTGHSLTRTFVGTGSGTRSCEWDGSYAVNNNVERYGVGVRGTINTARQCVPVNSQVMVTTEDDIVTTDHKLVVRDAETLALLYSKPLLYDGTPYAFGNPFQKFCFSTNDEGLFFQQCYTEPTLTSPPTPYPGAEFGAPDSRKIAVISVNPLTYEPTILELITLAENSYTVGSSFAVAYTA